MNRLPTKRVAALFGVTPKTIDRWAELHILRPDGHGRYSFDLLDLLSCAVARDLRARGFGLDQCGIVANWLRTKGLPELQSEWEQDQRYLLTIGAVVPYRRQWSHEEIFQNPQVELETAFAMGLPIAVIDLEAAFDNLMKKLDEPAVVVQ
jgi:DNA-binding transcriptional MerR regulator